MAGNGKEFKLGKLVVKGAQVEFRPEPSYAFEAKVGERGGFYLQYGYRETSPHKEQFRLRFTVELDGEGLGTREVVVEDAPVMRDEEWGLLEHATTFSRKGSFTGRYQIEGHYKRSGWWRRILLHATPIRESGTFTVTVR